MFVGSQVARILGYKDTDQAVRKHVSQKHKTELGTGESNPVVLTGEEVPVPCRPGTILITEAGFWSLAFGSKLPVAESFREWVFEDVLPSVRDQGYYALPGVLEAVIAIEKPRILELEGEEKNEFRRESKIRSDLTKDPRKVEDGKRGGVETQRRIHDLKENNMELKLENEKLKTELTEIRKILEIEEFVTSF